jgi:hypothetical protein
MGFGSLFSSAFNKVAEPVKQAVAQIATTAKKALETVIAVVKAPAPGISAAAKFVESTKAKCAIPPKPPATTGNTQVAKALVAAKPGVKNVQNVCKSTVATTKKSPPTAKTVNACFNDLKKKFDVAALFKPLSQSCPKPLPSPPFTPANPHDKECPYKSVMVPINFILSEMKNNASGSHVKYIKQGLSHWDRHEPPVVKAGFVGGAFIYFGVLVMPHGIWDHKSKILSDYGGKWTCDKPNLVNYSYDIWSNIHFGYIGRAAGFPESALSSGAGFAQLLSMTVPEGYRDRVRNSDYTNILRLLDDPDDQAAIQIGFDLWKKYGTNVTAGNILDAVRASRLELKTRICDSAGQVLGAYTSNAELLQGPALGPQLQSAGQGVPAVKQPWEYQAQPEVKPTAPPQPVIPPSVPSYDGKKPATGTEERNQAKQNNPPLTNGINNRNPNAYEQVINQFAVENNPRYSPKFSAENTITATYCNIFAWDVTRAMNAEIPHWVDSQGAPAPIGKGRELSANGTVDWLHAYGEKYGWRKATEQEAQQKANNGSPVVATWKNPSGQSGHIAMVLPKSQPSNESTKIAQAGAKNYNNAPLTKGFGTGKSIEFWVHD